MPQTQKNCSILPRPGRARRCRHGKDQKPEAGAPEFAADGFLKARFLPIVQTMQPFGKQKDTERGIFESLKHLSALYDFAPLDISGIAYPLNILRAVEHATAEINRKCPDLNVWVIDREGRQPCFATVKRYNTGNTLYYLPLKPLHDWMGKPGTKQHVELLLPVMAYLTEVACIPSYTKGDFMESCYDSIQEWAVESMDCEEEMKEGMKELDEAREFGRALTTEFTKPCHLFEWGARLDAFVPTTPFDERLQRLSMQGFHMYRDYPKTPFYKNFLLDYDEDEDGDTQSLPPDEYITLTWSHEGWLAEQMQAFVDVHLQEMPEVQEPVSFQVFDRPHKRRYHNMRYENRFFSLLNKLADFIYQEL